MLITIPACRTRTACRRSPSRCWTGGARLVSRRLRRSRRPRRPAGRQTEQASCSPDVDAGPAERIPPRDDHRARTAADCPQTSFVPVRPNSAERSRSTSTMPGSFVSITGVPFSVNVRESSSQRPPPAAPQPPRQPTRHERPASREPVYLLRLRVPHAPKPSLAGRIGLPKTTPLTSRRRRIHRRPSGPAHVLMRSSSGGDDQQAHPAVLVCRSARPHQRRTTRVNVPAAPGGPRRRSLTASPSRTMKTSSWSRSSSLCSGIE